MRLPSRGTREPDPASDVGTTPAGAGGSPVDRASEWLREHGNRVMFWAVGAVAVFAFVLRSPGTLYVDTRPDLYLDPVGLLASCFQIWTATSNLGAPNFDVGYLPPALALAGPITLGLPAWLAQGLWRLLLFVVAATGADRFLRHNASDPPTPAARWAVALTFALGPFALVDASSTPVMLPMALLPWLLLAYQRCLAPGGWRHALVFGLVFFAMGGINAGVVNFFLLVSLPVVLADARWRVGRAWRHLVVGTLAAGVAALWMSFYWIAATVMSFGSASTVAATTESPEVVSATMSYAEVLRGLGSWIVYGADQSGPFLRETIPFIANPLVILATFVFPVLAFVGVAGMRDRARPLAWALMLVGAVVMVGMYTPAEGVTTPYGRTLSWAFDNIPGFLAFRTTMKVGPVMALGLAMLVGLSVQLVVRHGSRRLTAALIAVLLLAGSLPLAVAIRGNMFWSGLDVPGYWHQATDDVNSRDADGRVWLQPGESNTNYRWRARGIDDFATYFIERDSFYRRSYPDVPAFPANLLAAVDSQIQSGEVQPGVVSTASRYLGAADLLVRNDLRWERAGGVRPAELVDGLEADDGLSPSALYGGPGTNVLPGREWLGRDPEADAVERELAPLIRYRVDDPGAAVTAAPAEGHVLVVGDNFGAVSLMGLGVLEEGRPFEMVGSLDDASLIELLGQGGRTVLTDSNRRRDANDRSLNASGPLVSEHRPLGPTRTLFEPDDQTVAEFGEVADAQATASGSIFGPQSSGSLGQAFDGDRDTAWRFGDFGQAPGVAATVRFRTTREVERIRLVPAPTAPVALARARVDVGGFSERVVLSDGPVTVDVPPGTLADDVTVTVLQSSGDGWNQVGFAEIEIDDLDLRQSARMPRTLAVRAEQNPDLAAALEDRPLDIAFQRETALERERGLLRRFETPFDRSYALSGISVPVDELEAAAWRPEESGGAGECFEVGTLDAEPLMMRAVEELPNGTARLEGCDAPIDLDDGSHVLDGPRTSPLKALLLTDQSEVLGSVATTPDVIDPELGDTRSTATLEPSDEPYYLAFAQSFDPGFRATLNGEDLGAPVPINGYALGFRVPAGPGGEVVVEHSLQGPYVGSLAFSLIGVVVGLLVQLVRLARLRRLGRRRSA